MKKNKIALSVSYRFILSPSTNTNLNFLQFLLKSQYIFIY